MPQDQATSESTATSAVSTPIVGSVSLPVAAPSTQAPAPAPSPKVESKMTGEPPDLSAFNDIVGKKVVDVPKSSEDDETESPEQDIPKAIEQQPAKPTPKRTPRDFTGLEEDETKLFREMNNEAFARLKPIYLEHKQVKKQLEDQAKQLKDYEAKMSSLSKPGIPESFYAHPESYTLTPEYKQLAQKTTTADQIYRHWIDQLARCRNGADWQDLDMNEKGELVVSKPQAATGDAEAAIIDAIQHSSAQRMSIRQELNSLVTEHKNQFSNVNKYVQELEQKYFPSFSEEQLAKPENAMAKKLIEDGRNSLPKALQSNILASPLAKSYALIVTLINTLKDRDAQMETLRLGKKDEQKQPIKETSVSSTPKSSGASLEDFSALLR